MKEEKNVMLIDELERLFGTEVFDATDVFTHAQIDKKLAATIDATVPRARYKDQDGIAPTR